MEHTIVGADFLTSTHYSQVKEKEKKTNKLCNNDIFPTPKPEVTLKQQKNQLNAIKIWLSKLSSEV